MKQGRPLITFVIALFAGALVLYFLISLWKTFQDPFTTTYTYSYTLNDSIQTEGLIIRDEQVLSGSGGIVDVTRGEGEKVGVNQTVALIYRDDQARQSQEQQEALRLEITQLQYALGQGEDVSSAAKLNDDILNAMVSLRTASAQQDFSDLEDQVLEVKGKVLRREYTYSDELSAESLTTRLQELETQYQTLRNQSYSAITQVTAPTSGTFSTLVDGYEGLINSESAGNLTPQALQDLLNQDPSGDSAAVGKLISSDKWYFAAVVTQEEGERLEQAGTLTLRFAGDFTQDISMTVEKVNQDGQGQAVVLLSSDRYLEQTTLLRRETAELIFNSRTGLRVPKSALRMVTTTSTDEETGEETVTVTWAASGEDVTGNADTASLLAELGALTFTKCVDYKPTDEAAALCGFDAPQATVTILYLNDTGTEGTLTLTFGSENLDQTGYYVRMEGDSTIYQMDTASVDTILSVAENGLTAADATGE